MINLGYTFKNSLHYYDNEEGVEDDGSGRDKDSHEMQELMASWAQDMAKTEEVEANG